MTDWNMQYAALKQILEDHGAKVRGERDAQWLAWIEEQRAAAIETQKQGPFLLGSLDVLDCLRARAG